jgi:signal transduction histidine kinase
VRPDRPTRRRLRTRQAVLFLAAIGLPCLVLVALSLRMIAQERELAEKRLADERRRMAVDVRQDLRSRLDHLRLEALNGARRGAPGDAGAVVLIARLEGDRLVLPWDVQPETAEAAAALADPAFAAAVRDGERDELVALRFEAAVASYRRALGAARLPVQTAFAQLLVARALGKAGRAREAHALYRRVLSTSPPVVDEQGVPLALYAARRLLDAREPDAAALPAVLGATGAIANAPRPLPAAAVYMARDVAAAAAQRVTGADREAADALTRTIEATARDLEQALALAQAFPALAARFATGAADRSDPIWVPFGERPRTWLIGLAEGQPVVAVRAEPLLASLSSTGDASLELAVSAGGEALGPDFPGLGLSFPAGTFGAAAAPPLQRSFYMTALVLVVSMALLGAYLFWRDVQRDVRLAEMRSQFVSSVSHELKTPLTAIRMFAETLLLGRARHPDAREEYLETIVNESERLTRLLNNVLDFSKIEQGKKLYRLEPHSLGAIVRAAAKAMQYPLSQQGFELRVSIDDRLPPVSADADAVEQAILNLLSNAMKYSGQSRTIDLMARRDGDRAVVAVTDRGVGIAPHEQRRIFEKFYRIEGPDRDRTPGTGLGLTLVEHVARAHGGAVHVESVPGEGSTFSIVLPLAAAPDEGATPEEALA